MKRDYDVKVRVRELQLGELVYQLDTATVKGKGFWDCLRVSLATQWAPSIAVCNSPTYWSPSGCLVFPGLPNISSAGNPISLPNIIILSWTLLQLREKLEN
jgi:hypothetical protein